jgi:Spy/CpxP family protein refolding chaperone
MKKIFLSLLAFSVAFAVSAQEGDRHGRHGKMKGKHEMMAKKLELTDAQQSQMKTINEDFRKQFAELKKNENITVKEYKDRMAKLRQDHKTRIQSVLTVEQKSRIEKMKLERKTQMKERMKDRGDRMKTELGLSADQSAKMDGLKKEMGEKMKAIRENKALDDAAKKEQLKKLKDEHQTKMKAILTPEQLEKMKTMRRSHKGEGRHGKGEKI